MTQDYSTKWWAAFSCIAFLEAVLLILLVAGHTSELIVVAIIAIAFLLFLFPRLDDVISMTLERGMFETKINAMNKKIATTKARTDKLFLLSMSESMYKNLKKIDSGSFGPYEIREGLERELSHLRDTGYIQFDRIRDIPFQGNNLSEHVKVTKFGKQYIELRDSVEKEMSDK